jgi:hypothetical protein
MRTLATKALATLLIAAGVIGGILIVRGRVLVPSPEVLTSTAPTLSRAIDVQRHASLAQPSASAQDHSRELVRDVEAALVSVDDRERDRALRDALPRLIAIDPFAAARILDRTPRGFSRDEARDRVARLWAAANLDGALQWVTTLEDDADRRLATTAITSQVAASDPASAIEISDLMDVGRDDGTLAHIAQMWSEENPSAAQAWAENQPAGPLRDELLARVPFVRAARRAAVGNDLE